MKALKIAVVLLRRLTSTPARLVVGVALVSAMLAVGAGPAAADPGGGDIREYCSSWMAAGQVDTKACVKRWKNGGDITHYVLVKNPQSYTVKYSYTLQRMVDNATNACSRGVDVPISAGNTHQYTCYSTRQYNSSYSTATIVNHQTDWSPTTWG